MDDDVLVAELRAAHAAAPTRPVDPGVALAGGRRRRRVLGLARTGGVTAVVAVAPDGPADPADLVGYFEVSGAAGLGGDVWLAIAPGSLQVWAGCGPLGGVWEANGATILATSVSRASDDCTRGAVGAWLDGWWTYTATDDGWTIADRAGAAVATLIEHTSDPTAVPMILTADPPAYLDLGGREQLAEPAPLPDGVRAASPDDVLGRWVPASVREVVTAAHVELREDGRWSGHDGCPVNTSEGRWAVGPDGRLLSTDDLLVHRAVACLGGPSASLISGGARAAVDGGQLVIYDRSGNELGRLVRAGTEPGPTDAPPAPDLEAACGGPCASRPNGWTDEQAALLGPLVDRLEQVGSAHPEFVGVGPEYGTSDLVLYWAGPVAPDVQAVVDEAAAQGVGVRHKDDAWPGWAREARALPVLEALERAGIELNMIGPYDGDPPGLRMAGPDISTDPALQEAARRVAAHVVGPDVPLVFEPYEEYVNFTDG